ncbi:enoyl-CoA hydratase-related protein [Pseudonocardia eucalypti]|uniref:Enoyl-CoA hydratase-related protein n=1 Tax=Pseudonocardia eucalypti TaxID=648755 RepID=A0ABP9QD95_9PSEU|nr:2-(1,2-epoxy-1,2-dihydrophenyl)acetyl-CoA isomerase [Pseudonocardia eucalypti]
MSDRTVLEIADGLARLRLTRPDRRNAIDMAMAGGIAERMDQLVAATDGGDVRAVLIEAEGPAFTVGGDVDHLAGQLDRLSAELDDMITRFHGALARLAELPVPVVTAARGAVAGGGLGLFWCADLAIAGDDLRIATGFARLALSGDGGSSWHLPRLVGLRRAQELLLGGRVLDAAEALDWGLVTRVVPADELATHALAVARELVEGPTYAFGRMKRLLRESGGNTYREQLEAERAAIVDCGATSDGREGLAAFAERRSPRFTGR